LLIGEVNPQPMERHGGVLTHTSSERWQHFVWF
jgi:hypothetical protein